MDKSKGFTLIEILVVTAITLIFLGVGLVQYNTYTEQAKLKNEGKKLVDVLELAKKKALSADLYNKTCTNFSGYRVIISLGNYSLNFNCGGVYTKIQDYNLTTNNSITGGTGNYDFTPLMVNPIFPSNPLNTTLSIKNSSLNKSINITVTPIGVIELDETLL